MKRNYKLPKIDLKRGDIVEAISGEDAIENKTGKVMNVDPIRQRATVEGFNLVKKTMKKSQDNPQGGIIEKEAPIAISNLRVTQAQVEKKGKKRTTKKDS